MSCPFFYPTESRSADAVYPLGDWWMGRCYADAAHPFGPADLTPCNLGYARGECACFPSGEGAGAAADAVRFAVASAAGTEVTLHWSIERDHYPVAHGTLAWERDAGFSDAPEGLLAPQAAAYIASYRRRKGEI